MAESQPVPWYVRWHLLWAKHALSDSYYHPGPGVAKTWVFKCDCGRVWMP